MVVTKDSPNRRRSIATTSHSQPAAFPRRRRAHSVAPRTSLSPQAKARRLLVPRKSILKTSFIPDDLESQPQDDTDITQSMDLTQDFRARIRDHVSRKSFGRRVSFADHAHVRIFQIPNTTAINPASSSPGSASSEPSEPDVEPPPHVSDENDYPNANPSRRRRSSVRYSIGSDMDLTSVGAFNFPGEPPDVGSAILDEDFGDMDDMEMEMSDDMDVTQAFHGNLRRRSSVAPTRRETLGHPPSAILQMDDDEGDQTNSSIGEDSIISDAPGDVSERMEFTVPMGRSLRPPAQEDEVWLALRQATHSGDTSIEPQEESFDDRYNIAGPSEMPLGDAVQRLMRARDSLSRGVAFDEDTANLDQIQEDTVSSVGSLDNDENSNKTMNLSRVMGRFSAGGDATTRMSLGTGETSMDVSDVYGNIVAARSSRQSLAPPSTQESVSEPPARPPTVFHLPPPRTNPQPPAAQPTPTQASSSKIFSQPPTASPFKSRTSLSTPVTTSQTKPKPTFTAAFAPPVAKTSPKKVPSKRLQREESDIENVDSDKPSPAKRQALAEKWTDVAEKPAAAASTPAPNAARPRPLSPSKKALFQPPPQTQTTQQAQTSLRPPSGYMARRKSLAVGLTQQPTATQSPRRKAGRASMGSASQDAWKRFDKAAPLPKKALELQKTSQSQPMDEVATPSLHPSSIRRSQSPHADPTLAESSNAMDLSTVLQGPTFGDADHRQASGKDKAERWVADIDEDGYEDDDMPAISIGQFFEMTNIKFMDEIAAPRRSIHPGQQLSRRSRPVNEIGLSEYAIAMAIDLPQLDLYTKVSSDLNAWMEKSKVSFAEAEDEASKVTPELFVEYARADEDGQAELLHQLNFIKTNARGSAKSDWYDWKLKWVEGLKGNAVNAFADLESDAKKLEALNQAASELIPDLEKEYAEVIAELEREQAEVAEIEASDQDYLNELKASIAEQNIEVEALKAEVNENSEQLTWLNKRLADTEQQKQEVSAAIAKAERVLQIQKNSTRREVFHLKDELDALEDLHLTRIIKVNERLFEYIYDSTYRVAIPCSDFTPNIPKIAINRLDYSRTAQKDEFPKLSKLFLTCASAVLDEERDVTVRQIVHKLGDYWTSCSQLRSHLRLLNIKYPVDMEISPPSSASPTPSFKARATLMFPKVMGKAHVFFLFDLPTFSEWPVSIDSLNCEVDVAYGSLDRAAILKAVVDRLAQATPSDNYALLDSCIDAQALYN